MNESRSNLNHFSLNECGILTTKFPGVIHRGNLGRLVITFMAAQAQQNGWLGNTDKLMICFLKGQGDSNREIARKMHRSHTCINHFITGYFSGSIKVVRPVDPQIEHKFILRQYILAETLADRFMTCRQLSDQIRSEFRMSCCKSEVALVRRSLGLKHLWAKKTEKLTQKHIDKRFAFAKSIQNHELFSYPWIISDESSFVVCPTRRKLYRFRGENTACVFQEFQGYPVKCMVWGAIGPDYKSRLIHFKQYVTAQTYVAMLTEKQMPENLDIFEKLDLQFGHDGYVNKMGLAPILPSTP
jgi:transposase